MGPQEREELFEKARRYSTERTTWDQADKTWVRVIAAYREAVDTATRVDRHDQRQLARALWRHGMLLGMIGRPAEGVTAGRAAVSVFELVDQAVSAEHPDPTTPRRDESLGELITAVVDLGEISFVAGQPGARLELLEQALSVGLRQAGPPPGAGPKVQDAMGTAYHNQATALVHGLGEEPTPDDAMPAALAASRAIEIRQGRMDPSNPITAWELANTYVIYAECLRLIHDFDRATMVLQLGDQLLGLLGPAAADIRRKHRATAVRLAESRRATNQPFWRRKN